jgi:menaquinol-cytochrome c reductase iron-sulfur subunit
MSTHENQDMQHGEQQRTRREMSRRQFLSYTLGGAGAFMSAGILVPMLRFSVDPILQPKQKGAWVKVAAESDITEEPKSVTFTVHQVDGWYESDPTMTAWIAKKDGKIFALSPICKHLGCTINWSANNNQYICPCHNAHYTKEGKNLTVAPSPLDEYDVKVENGFVYLGELHANTLVK